MNHPQDSPDDDRLVRATDPEAEDGTPVFFRRAQSGQRIARHRGTIGSFRGAFLLRAVALRRLIGLQLAMLGLRLQQERTERSAHPERGDVPGWVMVTLMTAALVALLLAVAGPALEGLFRQAIDTVSKK